MGGINVSYNTTTGFIPVPEAKVKGSGIHDAISEKINIYPNPTNGELRIENGELRITNVEIYDVYGRKVLEPSLTVLRSYDLTVLSAGVYFLRIATDQGTVTKKVIKN